LTNRLSPDTESHEFFDFSAGILDDSGDLYADGAPACVDMGFPKHQSSEVRDFPLFMNVRPLPMDAAAQPNPTEFP
jgi:hypothetical protein